jgi:hypothetical protein
MIGSINEAFEGKINSKISFFDKGDSFVPVLLAYSSKADLKIC